MKVLSLTRERSDASAVASALHPSYPDVTVTWTARFEDATRWIGDNGDLNLLVLDAGLGSEACGVFVDSLRRRGLTAPTIVLAPADADTGLTLAAIGLGPGDCVLTHATLPGELPSAVRRADEQRGCADTASALHDAQPPRGLAAKASAPRSTDATAASLVAELQIALAQSERTRAAEAKAAAEQLAKHIRSFSASLGELLQKRAALAQRVSDLEQALAQLQGERTPDAEAAAAREHDAESRLADEIAQREAAHALEAAVLTAERDRLAQALDQSQQDHANAQAGVARAQVAAAEAERALEARLAREQARLAVELDRETAARREVEQRLVATEAELATAVESAALHLTRVEGELRGLLAQEVEQRLGLEAALARAQHERQQIDEQHGAALGQVASQLAEQDARCKAMLAEAAAQRADLEDRLHATHAESRALATQVEAIRTEAAAERQALALRLRAEAAADHRADLDVQRAAHTVALEEQQARADREQLEAAERLRATSLERDDIQRERDDARAEAQELRDRVGALAQRLDDDERIRQQAEEAFSDERAAAAEQLASRERALTALATANDQLDASLAKARAALVDAEKREHIERTERLEAAEQASACESRLRDELAHERELRCANEARWAEREATLMAVAAESEATLRTFEAHRREAERSRAAIASREATEQKAAAERYAALEAQLHAERARREAVEQERNAVGASLRESRQATERMRGEHAHVVTRLERQMAEADSQYTELAARQAAAERAHEGALAQQRESLTAAATLHQAEVEHVRSDRAKVARELETVTLALADVRTDAERRFDEHPLPQCRCTPGGMPIRANRAFAALLGCTSDDPNRALEAAANLFASSGDVAWLVQHVDTLESSEPVETVWKNAQGSRVAVRLSAARVPDGIDILVQDITEQILMRERLERARRMEAVGRLASEVAATCETTLEEVRRSAQGWLGSVQGQSSQRLRAELILADVVRVLQELRRFHAYGEAQADDVEPVDIHRTLRGLEPLLKEVAGDDIELVLPKRGWLTTNRCYVDVRGERVERILVNVAAYARQRMPNGGVVSFELQEAQLDRAFVEQYPSARPGPHALLTVKEVKDRPRSLITARRFHERAHTPDEPSGADQVGVDLGALQELVRASGGHLWVEATPGHLTIKIHLPSAPPNERRWSPVSVMFRREA